MATIHRRIILKDLNDPDNQVKDTKGTFHAKMGSIKDRNGRDLTEAEYYDEVARIHRRTIQKRSL